MPSTLLDDLQSTIHREIPVCALMAIEVRAFDERGLVVACPLQRNRNHCGTAFAGSLNALCTVAGWGQMFLLCRQHELRGKIVIHRSSIKYREPVETPEIHAVCRCPESEAVSHFLEMYRSKRQGKLELEAGIKGVDGNAVSFRGSYVVTPMDV